MKENTTTITLEFPVKLADGELTEVTMRRPVMGDIRKNPIKGAEDVVGEMKLLGVLTGLRPDDFDLFDTEDYGRLQEAFISFRPPAN